MITALKSIGSCSWVCITKQRKTMQQRGVAVLFANERLYS